MVASTGLKDVPATWTRTWPVPGDRVLDGLDVQGVRGAVLVETDGLHDVCSLPNCFELEACCDHSTLQVRSK